MSITDALICLLISVENGKTAVFEDSSDRVIRAEWIRHLVLGLSWPIEVHERWKQKNSAHILPEAGGSVQIGYPGLSIRGAKIVGTLDLSGCGSTQSPLSALSFEECCFEGDGDANPSIDLSRASLCGLNLKKSRFRHLRGVGMTVTGSVDLSEIQALDDNEQALCSCKLSLCKIDGDLIADKTKMRAPEVLPSGTPAFHDFPELNWALNIYGSRIAGTLFLRMSPVLYGGVLTDRAHIGGDIYIEGAQITAVGTRYAIAMERTRIDGSLILMGLHNSEKKMVCRGAIFLMLCEVGGSVDIARVDFIAHTMHRHALYATGLSARGWVHLNTITSENPILLKDAKVGGNLIVKNIHIQAQRSLDARGARVTGTLVLQRNEVSGVDFTDVHCATLEDSSSGYGRERLIRIDGFRYERMHEPEESITDEARLEWWLPKGKDNYRPQPYVQLAQVLANHGQDAFVRRVLTAKAEQDAAQAWNDKLDQPPSRKGQQDAGQAWNDEPKQATSWREQSVKLITWYGRKAFYYFIVCPFGFFFDFGLSPTKAVGTVMAFIVIGWALFAFMDSRNVLVVAQAPVTTLVHKDEANPNKFKFASAFVSKAVPKSESEAVNGPASVQNSLSRNVSPSLKNSVPTNKSTPVEGRVSAQKPVTVKVSPPVIKPAPLKEEASLAGLEPVQKPVTANASAGGMENQHNGYSDSDLPCRDSIRLLVYAADVFIPLVDLREEGKCDIDQAIGSEASNLEITAFRLTKALYAILGWLVTGAAVVTVSGVMRHRLLRD